ncbi:glycosyltransferase [Flavobacterium sp. RSP49]|uniref:glycosyltransferase n=1 Tax=Flavobacterium sp. RSP49 TaxID=2497487 RepID=UPI000F83E7FC|nr:glycosyltransferase [Flavobacterium sp. RSP49]RTZ02923.1 glycosyltransferase [Flavobacterium sp. RSP49]
MVNPVFSLHITTKNRKTDLAFTLSKIDPLLEHTSVECMVFDDGSIDGTFEFVKQNYPKIILKKNSISKGYIFCRNKMLNETKADYTISLDDDAHFVSENPLESIRKHFEDNALCGLLAFRVFWGLEEPVSKLSNEKPHRVQGFVGCAHVWRMSAWREIPNYPSWFVFYGEEDFASFQLFKKKWEIHYLPEVLVNHRVNLKSRRNDADYTLRLRRSLCSGWYLFFLFYPIKTIPRKMAYSLLIQLKNKVFKGDLKALKAVLLALLDLVWSFPIILKNSNRLTRQEYEDYNRLPLTKIYWQPEIYEIIR